MSTEIKGKIEFDSIKAKVGSGEITLTDVGMYFNGKAQPSNGILSKKVEIFVPYNQIISCKKVMTNYNISVPGWMIVFAPDKKDASAFYYMEQQLQYAKQHTEHFMRCDMCGKVFSYSDADLERMQKDIKSAVRESRMAVGNALFGSQLQSSMQTGNAQSQLNSAMNQLDKFNHCPNCNSTSLTEITKEEAAESMKASAAPAAAAPAASSADELLKFKQLLDAGIITQEEFDAKKKQLLGL